MSISFVERQSSEDGVDFLFYDRDSASNNFDITVQDGGTVNIYIDGEQETEVDVASDEGGFLSFLRNGSSSLHPSRMGGVLYGTASIGIGYMLC